MGNQRGRPKALADKKTRDVLLKVLRQGGSLKDAAGSVGISYQTILNESKRDEDFGKQVRQAELKGKLECIDTIRKGIRSRDLPVAIKAATWLLERKYWDEWSRRTPDTISAAQLSVAVNRFVTAILGAIPEDLHPRISEETERLLDNLLSFAKPDGSSN